MLSRSVQIMDELSRFTVILEQWFSNNDEIIAVIKNETGFYQLVNIEVASDELEIVTDFVDIQLIKYIYKTTDGEKYAEEADDAKNIRLFANENDLIINKINDETISAYFTSHTEKYDIKFINKGYISYHDRKNLIPSRNFD